MQADQTGAQSGATTGRAGLEAAVAALARRRREIPHAALEAQVQVITDLQYAADTVWPAGKKNAATRTELKIPPNKGLKVTARIPCT